ncbi:MAG: glycosyltransferase [Gemmatimonadota bacterium]
MHILWLKTELLHPVDKGGRIRTYQTLRHLARSHRVTYLCLDDGSATDGERAAAGEYCHNLVTVPFRPARKGSPGFFVDLARNVFSSLPYAIARYRSDEMHSAIRRLVADAGAGGGPIDLVVCDFLAPSVNVPQGLRVPTVLFQHNVEAAIWARHATVPGNMARRRYMREQWRRMVSFEGRECRRHDHVIAVSEADSDSFRRDYGVTSVTAVPTGVDTDYFTPAGVERDRNEIVFVGSMDWLPNDDGVRWFAGSILPLIRRRVPAARLTIVGRDPTPAVRQLVADPAITVTGRVADVRPFVERAALVVVPLRVGGGTRLKIYEAMAMERAVVSTTIGAEGLPVTDGREIVIADEPDAFANAAVALLADSGRADRLGRAAADLVRSRFSWENVTREFARACDVARQEWRGGADVLPDETRLQLK